MAVETPVTPAAAAAASRAPASGAVGQWLRAWAFSAVPLVSLLLAVALRKTRYYWIGDTESQYGATFHFIGERLLAGDIPWLVPWQGSSANLLLDAQYGLLNPFSWLQSITVSRFENLQVASFVLVVLSLVLVQGGAVAWLQRLGVRDGWLVLGGFTAATGGYLLSSDAWLVLFSLAALAWLGWALAARQRSAWHALAIAVSTFAALASGAPFTAVAACLVIGAAAVETWLLQSWRQALTRQVLPAAAGAALAAPGYVFTAFGFEWTLRQAGLENSALYVPGLADVLNTGNATAGINMHNALGSVGWGMLVVAGGLSLAVLPLIAFPPRWWRFRGAITLTITVLGLLVLMQGPSDFGPLRWPVRHLGAFQLVLAVALVAAMGIYGIRASRARITAAVLVWAAFAFITLARSPQFLPKHLLSIALAGLLIGILALARPRVAPWLAVGTCFVIMLWALFGQPPSPRVAAWGQPTHVSDFQHPLGAGPERSLVLYPPDAATAATAQQGVFVGQNYLLGPARAGVGYSSVGQVHAAELMCTAINGSTCLEGVQRMLQTEPTTGRQWIDLLGVNTITAHRDFLPTLREGLPAGWRETQRTQDFVVFARPADPGLPGRISALPAEARATAVLVGDTSQTYQVTSSGGRVVLADVYWPGYTAEWNGEPLAVTPVADTLVAVELPPGTGTLTVSYRPAGAGVAVASVVIGLLLLAGALVVARRKASGRAWDDVRAFEPSATRSPS